MTIKTASGPKIWLAGQTPELVLPLVTAPLTLTTQLQADGFANGDNSYIYEADLAGYSQVRLTGLVKTVSNSVNTPVVQVRYSATFTQTIANFLQLGATAQVQVSLFTGVINVDSGWLDLAPLAAVNNCFLGLMTPGGNGVASPVINAVNLHFR